ncbi:MAG: helix-turn-helix domain-containing protein [Pseudomonadota bacterium]
MTDFGTVLTQHRRRKGWSQQQLADRADLSQRHISFLETGRSTPGKQALSQLILALTTDGYEADQLLAAAGMRSERRDIGWDDAAMAPVRWSVHRQLDHALPWPCYALAPDGGLLATNMAIDTLIHMANTKRDLWAVTGPDGPNIFDLTLHAEGIGQFLVNADEVVPALIQRLRRAALNHEGARTTLARVLRYPLARKIGLYSEGQQASPLVSESYRLGGHVLSFTAMSTHFGSNESEAMAGIGLETLVPADAETEHFLKALVL